MQGMIEERPSSVDGSPRSSGKRGAAVVMDEKPRTAQIAHVLFLDIVGYSRASTSSQGRMLSELNAAVTASPAFSDARPAEAVRPLPTGEGRALVFSTEVVARGR